MSQAEELLNGMSEEIPVHTHPVPDTDTYFVIDPVTRKIENTNPKKHVIMQYDHNSERCTFELPRFIDGHDMLECTSVTVNVDNIEVVESEGGEVAEPRVNSDAPDMIDLRIHPNDPEKVISSWLISRNSTQLAGILSFHIEYKCVDANGNVVYEWSTDNYDEYEIRARKKNSEAAVAEHTDLLEQWRTRIFGAGDSVMANIAAEGEAQVAAVKAESETQQEAVELKGAQTLDSIPEDYTEVDAMADEAVRSKADAIICSAEGETIVVSDSSEDPIRNLKIFGKTTQVKTTGKNLLNVTATSVTICGITYTVNADGSISANGTATDDSFLTVGAINYIGGTEYKISGCPSNGGMNTYTFYAVYGDGLYAFDTGNGITFTPATDMTKNVSIKITKGVSVSNVLYWPMVCLASSAGNTYEPYSGGVASPSPDWPQEMTSIENPTTVIYGRNLVDIHQLVLASNKSMTISEDGYTITLVGGSDKTYAYSHYDIPTEVVYALRGRNIRLASDFISRSVENAYSPVQLNVKCADNTFHYPVNHSTKLYHDFVVPHNAVEIRFGIYTNNTNNLLESDNTVVVKGVRLTLADDVEYEPYKPIGIVKVNYTLPGIPVTSGGNYTDENGQQWICDEVDLERGVYVQRLHIDTISPERINSVDNAYVSTGGSIAYFVPAYQHIQNDDVLLVMSNWCIGIPCKERNTHTDEYRCYTPASDPNVITLRYPISAGEKTLEEAKADFSGRSVMYVLREPIETPLTAEEIAAFKALRTNYPNTTILNDAGAWMSVKYNADIETWVDKLPTVRYTPQKLDQDQQKQARENIGVASPIVCSTSGTSIALPDAAELKIRGFTVNDGIDVETVNVLGKNLFYNNKGKTVTNIGVTVEWDAENQEFVFNGTTTAGGDFKLVEPFSIDWEIGAEYTFSAKRVGGTATLASGTSSTTFAWGIFQSDAAKFIRGKTGFTSFPDVYNFTGAAFKPVSGESLILYFQSWRPGTIFEDYRVKIQLEKGKAVTDWETYRKESYVFDEAMAIVPQKGYNTIVTSPTANITVDYVADTKLYIDNKIAEALASIQ